MTLLAPLSLFALLPWAAAVWLTWRGRSALTPVPFTKLWPASHLSRGRLSRQRPPLPILLALLAALLAIMAASRPRLAPIGPWSTLELTVITDHSPGTLAAGRLDEMNARLQRALDSTAAKVRLSEMEVDSREQLLLTAGREWREGNAVIVLTEKLLWDDARLYRLAPATPAPNAAITYAAVEGGQLLVRIETGVDAPSGPAMIHVADETFPVELPPAGASKDVILDLTVDVGDAFEVRLEAVGDSWAGDDVYTSALVRAWPRLEVGDVAEPVRRFAEVFADQRPPRRWSISIALASRPSQGSSITFAPAAREVREPVRLSDFPPALSVNWNDLVGLRTAEPPDASWTPVVVAGEEVLIAYRETSEGRQVWIGFDATDFQNTPAFVRLLADLVVWINRGPLGWGADVGSPPGITIEAGRPVATNLPRQSLGSSELADEATLRNFLYRHRQGLSLAPWLAVAGALVAAFAGFLVLRRDGGNRMIGAARGYRS